MGALFFIPHGGLGDYGALTIDRTAARHANKAWQAVVVLFLDKLIDSILGGLDHL